MTRVLLVQVLVSFFVGSSLITLLSVIAEKANQHISGIILMFPTTLVLGFFFLGLTTSAESVSNVIPFWGGIFTMFPAATFATLIILHFYYEPRQLFYFMKSAPPGSISLFIYAISIMLLFPKFGIWTRTLTSYLISLAFGLLLIKY